jgi:hypothetical protein
MKMKSCLRWIAPLPLFAAGAMWFAPTCAVKATPYATCLTNNGSSITFRLNEAADNVKIVYNGDTVTNDLGAVGAGLTNVPLSIVGNYKILVSKQGSGAIAQIGPSIPFNVPRGVAVNNNPADPNFGRVYVANAGAGTKGDGIYAYYSDLTDIFGTNRTAGYGGFTNSASASPMRLTVGPDGKVYICDWTDLSGNLIVTDPDVTSYQYVLKPLETNPVTLAIGTIPVGSVNTHGSVYGAAVTGSIGTGDLIVYTFDEDYQQDPDAAFAYQMNSVWEYRIGAGPLPWNNPPDRIMGVPSVQFASQNGDVAVGPTGLIYMNQRRANAGGPPGSGTWTPSLFIINTNNYIDPVDYGTVYNPDPANQPGQPGVFLLSSNYWGHSSSGGYIWESQSASSDIGSGGVDYFGEINGVAVSPDGKYVVGIHWGPYNGIGANALVFAPLTNGIPDLSQRFSFEVGGVAAGRGVAFDRANNVYMISSGLATFRAYSLGISATAITGSDGTFTLVTPDTVVSVAASIPTAYEAGTVSGQFTLSRTGDTTDPLAVNITPGGTATRGTDYVLKTNGVTFTVNTVVIPAGSANLTIEVAPTDDSIPELTETVLLNVGASGNYNVNAGASVATVAIVDNDSPQLQIVSLSTNIYERVSGDYATLTVRRYGDTNSPTLVLDTTNFTFSGTATSNVDYYLTNLPLTIDPGVVTASVRLLYPIDDTLLEGPETINLTMLAGAGFSVSNNTASTTITDDEQPAETVLFSDNFNTDSSANWTRTYGSANPGDGDYLATFAYDYSGLAIPPAPHSAADTLGLYMQVNKFDGTPAAAALNFYPNGQSFSGNYALRFDMYLIENSGVATTEYALFGINHSGTKTNWFRNSTGGVPDPSFDGLFYGVESDGAALGDYVLYSSPTTAGNNPTALTPGRNASTLTQVFKSPPWTPGAGGGGAPANLPFSATPSWADVEISQIGNVVTLKINNTVIFGYTNTTSYTSGDVMLGYTDAYDSIGSGEGGVVYDNVRVIQLGRPVITSIQLVGGNVVIRFNWSLDDPPGLFRLQKATSVNGPYANDGTATITRISAGVYQASTAFANGNVFFRISR